MAAQKVFGCNPLKKTTLEFKFQVIKDCKDLPFYCSLDVCTHSVKDLSAEYFKVYLMCFYISSYYCCMSCCKIIEINFSDVFKYRHAI